MISGSCTISWSKEMILDIRKAFSKRTTRSCAMLRIGSCPSHHSPNDVIPLSMTSNVHSQETITIVDQRASQLEAHEGHVVFYVFAHVLRFPDNTIIA